MRITRILLIIFIISSFFLLVLLFLLNKNKSVTDIENAYLIPPEEQIIQERKWKQLLFEKKGSSENFIGSTYIRFGNDDHIYLEDKNQMVIKKFDIEGNLIDSFGKGSGRGPGEFLTFADIVIDQSEKLWVLDDSNNRVTIFNTKKSSELEWKIIDMPEVAWRAIPGGNNQYLLENRFNSQMNKYTLSGELNMKLPPLVDNPSLWSYVLENKYSITDDGSIIKVFTYTHNLYRFTFDGELVFFREPVSPPEPAKINPYYQNNLDGKVNTVDIESLSQVTYAVHALDKTFHVFILEKDLKDENKKFKRKTIDVYDLSNGDYLYSYKLPEHLKSIAISGNHIAGIHEDSGKLVIWEVKSGRNNINQGGGHE